MGAASGHAEPPPFEAFRRDLGLGAVPSRSEAAGRVEVTVREVDLGQRARRDRMRGDGGISLSAAQGKEQLVPGPHLDVARGGELQADRACEIDVEAAQHAILVVEVEWREIGLRHEAHQEAARQVRRGGILDRRLGAYRRRLKESHGGGNQHARRARLFVSATSSLRRASISASQAFQVPRQPNESRTNGCVPHGRACGKLTRVGNPGGGRRRMRRQAARSGQRSGSGVQRGEQPELPAGRHAPVSFMDASCALPLFLRKGTGRGVRPAQCSEKLSVISSATIGAASARGHLRHATRDLLRRTPDLSASGPRRGGSASQRWRSWAAPRRVRSWRPTETCAVLLGFISIVFLCLVVLRALGLVRLLGACASRRRTAATGDWPRSPRLLDPRPALSRGGGRA